MNLLLKYKFIPDAKLVLSLWYFEFELIWIEDRSSEKLSDRLLFN